MSTPPYGTPADRRAPTYPPRAGNTLPLPDDYVTPHFRRSEWRQPALYGLPAVEYPAEWVTSRLLPLCQLLEVVRMAAGHRPIGVLEVGGGYRTALWNERHRDAGHGAALLSQHVEGRAADIRHATLTARELHHLIVSLHRSGQLPDLGGLGLYDTFVHVDTRPHRAGELDLW